jgi:serine phosphatase RsbU (regulator of sigma subunit)
MSDSILFLGGRDEKLAKFLQKLGYRVVERDDQVTLADLVAQANLDIVVIDNRQLGEAADLCGFLRSQESTKALPIVLLATERSPQLVEELSEFDRVELMPEPISIGALAGKIATELRLRKFAGKDELKATLAEINATLRDYNERFRRELEEARAIQTGLLPAQLPSDARFQLAVSYQPLEEVGGDWYFASKCRSGKLALQIADVTGHGLGAAFVGSMAKLAMAAVGAERPDELLKGMNTLMAPQIPPGRFVTMCSLLYDPESGVLQFARAGHPPALLVRKGTGEVIQLKGDGFAIGFFEDSEYSLVEDKLEPGDMLLLYTDGISEAQNRSMKPYGLDRLSAALQKCAGGASCGDVLGGVLDDVDVFREERIINDDVTALCLRRTS